MALGKSSDESVPGEAIGFFHLVEDGARVLEIAVVGESAGAKNFCSDKGVSNLAGFDVLGVKLLKISHGF